MSAEQRAAIDRVLARGTAGLTAEDLTLFKQLAGYRARGWYPLRWAHHPREVKDALRRHRIRPRVKGCMYNSQRFFLATAHDADFADCLEYREGWADKVRHAWLVWRGQILDLSCDVHTTVYGESLSFTREQVSRAKLERGEWSFIREDLRALGWLA